MSETKSVKSSEGHTTLLEKIAERGGLLRRMKEQGKEPYWIGSLIQAVTILCILLSALLGVYGALSLLFLFAAFAFIPTFTEMWLTKKHIDKQSGKEFELRFKSESHIADDFPAEQASERAKNPYFDNMVYLFHVLHFVILFAGIAVAGYTESYVVASILALALGLFYAPVAESYSHEFVHRRSLFQQMFGASVWASYCYGTFLPEHTMGHHVHVSTPEDPSSAPKDMTLYQFLPIALKSNTINGFKLEAKRLRDRNKKVISVYNRTIWLSLFSLSLLVASWLIAGSHGLFFFIAFTIGGVITIEVANYVMHYGLQRSKLENGRYERVSPLHSWNREGITNFFVINLIRHSDHHAFPRRPYQNLRNFPEAPELPLPYEMLLYLPYFPKLWFKIMNPSVDKHMNKLKEWRENNVDDYQMVMGIDGDRVK